MIELLGFHQAARPVFYLSFNGLYWTRRRRGLVIPWPGMAAAGRENYGGVTMGSHSDSAIGYFREAQQNFSQQDGVDPKLTREAQSIHDIAAGLEELAAAVQALHQGLAEVRGSLRHLSAQR